MVNKFIVDLSVTKTEVGQANQLKSTMSLILLFFLSIVGFSYAQFANCSSINTCSKCISTASCLWCSAVGSNVGCFSQDDDLKKDMCGQNNVGETVNKILQVNNNELDEDNQVTLESLNVKLRVGEPLDFTVSVKAAEDFPLDIYMLMDLSGSFKDDLDVVKSLAPQLPLALQDVSSDFLIGFGSYVDKPSLPYVSSIQINGRTVINGQESSCISTLCAIPFNYEHVVSLTNSSDHFNSSIQKTIISNNVDDPEDILGAMLQAVVCQDLVGWREKSRKILLVMTDDIIHTAGDGRLAGIVKPNDGQCHTEYDPSYDKIVNTAAIMQDYPSIEQVREVLQNDDIVPVFAVASPSTNLFNLYNRNVGPLLGGFTATLAADSSNLVNVLEEAYLKVVSNARLSFNLPSYLSASINAKCPYQSMYLPQSYECTNISNGTVNYTITLTLLQCTDNLKNGVSEQVLFSIPGFGQFTVNVNGICSCDCDNKTEYNSSTCSTNGDLTCGLCTCTNGWTENDCSCSTAQCPLGPNGAMCSGRGQCECGQCICKQPTNPVLGVVNPRIVGNACECSNYECETDSSGRVCSGRGTCTCSNGEYNCECDNSTITGLQYSGDSCQCSFDNCVDRSNPSTQLCGGRGTCDPCKSPGSACTCDDGYTGQYCSLAIQGRPQCISDEDCVKCYAKENDPALTCSSSCIDYNALYNRYDINTYTIPNTISGSTQHCSFSTTECKYVYYIALSMNSTLVYEVEPESCLPIPIWAIVLIILCGLIIIGIFVIVLIKLILMYRDHREYKQFVWEVNQAKHTKQDNPVYLNPITETMNPVHGKPL